MSKKNSSDLLELLIHFQQKIINNKPPLAIMWEEIRMMKFKIRPLEGDLSKINLHNEKFIEALWSLGQFDAFFQREFPRLKEEQKQVFFRLLDNFYQKFQMQFRNISLSSDKPQSASEIVEMEIFKERNLKEN